MGPLPANYSIPMCFRTLELNLEFSQHLLDYQNLVYRNYFLRVDNTVPSKEEFRRSCTIQSTFFCEAAHRYSGRGKQIHVRNNVRQEQGR